MTNIDKIREVAHILLKQPFKPTAIPFIVHHPFNYSNPILYYDNNAMIQIDAIKPEDAPLRVKWRIKMGEIIDNSSLTEILNIIQKPYKFTFLYLCKDYISSDELGEIIKNIWCRIENISSNSNINEIIKLLEKANKNTLMTKNEQTYLNNLPEKVTLYRGVTEINRYNKKALSWTTDKNVALWFANRFKTDYRAIWTITIPKSLILCYFETSEKECIVNLKNHKTKIKIEEI